MLERELRDLLVEADDVERRVQAVARRGEDDDGALPLLESVFAEQAATARAELRAALEDSVRRVETRLAAAGAEIEAMRADGVSVAGDRRRPEAPAPPVSRPVAVVEPAPALLDPVLAESEAEPAAFRRFWDAEPGPADTAEPKSSAVDVILPFVAVVLIVFLALSMMG